MLCFHLYCHIFGSAYFSSKEGVPILLSIRCMYKSLVFGDEFLAQGLLVKSHQRCSAGVRTLLSANIFILCSAEEKSIVLFGTMFGRHL